MYSKNFNQHDDYVHGQLRKKRLFDFFNFNSLDCFIETGTYRGDGVQWAFENNFQKILSTELNENLFLESKKRFLDKKNIEIHNLDTIEFLKNCLPLIDSNCLIYLDAHISGDDSSHNPLYPFPLIEECTEIIRSLKTIKDSIIIIDDERLWSEDMKIKIINLFSSFEFKAYYIDDSIVICDEKFIK